MDSSLAVWETSFGKWNVANVEWSVAAWPHAVPEKTPGRSLLENASGAKEPSIDRIAMLSSSWRCEPGGSPSYVCWFINPMNTYEYYSL